MKNVSGNFINQITIFRNFEYAVSIIFSDGIKKELTTKDLMIDGCYITNSTESSSFPLGVAVAKTLNLAINNNDGFWDSYNFYGASVHVVLSSYIEATKLKEYIDLGMFKIINPETPGNTIEITGVDYMYQADKTFISSKSNITMAELFYDVCDYCNLNAETNSSSTLYRNVVCPNGDYVISEIPEKKTCRELLCYIACISGGVAHIKAESSSGVSNADVVKITQFEFTQLENIYDGGDLTDYSKPDLLDGGDYTTEGTTTFDGGNFTSGLNYHYLTLGTSVTYPTDDVKVTGLKIKAEDDTEIKTTTYSDSYVLTLENPLIQNNAVSILDRIGTKIIGYAFRPFNLDYISYPLIDLGDMCVFTDRKFRMFASVITDYTFNLKGATTIKCSAESPTTNGSDFISPTAVAVEQAKRNTDKLIAKYDVAVQRMNEVALNSLGYFETNVDDETNGRITYIHDKKELANSTIIYKKTINGFFVSRDGGATYVNGYNAETGEAVLNILDAIGINANWINTGDLTVGGNITNTDGRILVKDANNKTLVQFDKNGMTLDASQKIQWANINSPSDLVKTSDIAGTVTNMQTVYFLNNSTTSPDAPKTWVTNTSTGAGVWTTVVPTTTNDYNYIHTCMQTKCENSTFSNTPVTQYVNSTVATKITKDTVTTSYVESLKISASYLSAGTIDAKVVTISNLEVGTNVAMGSNATINWSQVNDASTNVTSITKDTVTTSYVNALGVTASNVSASSFYGKNYYVGYNNSSGAVYQYNSGTTLKGKWDYTGLELYSQKTDVYGKRYSNTLRIGNDSVNYAGSGIMMISDWGTSSSPNATKSIYLMTSDGHDGYLGFQVTGVKEISDTYALKIGQSTDCVDFIPDSIRVNGYKALDGVNITVSGKSYKVRKGIICEN